MWGIVISSGKFVIRTTLAKFIRMKRSISLIAIALLINFASQAHADDTGHLTIDVQHPTFKISPTFYGLMTEEINHAYDGGLYAELIQNRALNDANGPAHWSLVKTGQGDGTIELDNSVPDNTALKKSLKLEFTAIGTDSSAGVANDGYWGMAVHPDTQYRASLYAKGDGQFPLTLSIQASDGSVTYATTTLNPVDSQWKKYDAVLTTNKDFKPTADARFVISASGKGTLWVTLVSLFPPTYNNRPNGNRIDLMQLLNDLHPTFLRFPGGNYLEGNNFDQYFAWKKTLGPIDQRPGHRNDAWRYHSSDGMGLLEFLEWCEDLHMHPVLAVFAGYVLTHHHVEAGAQLQPYVDEALDEIEYCTGDKSTKWGARRAADGHPDPFKIEYVEIGNEDQFDNPRGNYEQRFAQIFDAIKAKYPDIKCIATIPVKSRKPDVVDDHYYRSSRDMERDVHHYDKTDRNGPKVFVGEWATREGAPTPNFGAALADAAWLTGLERNSDIVVMNCYAPLFVNVNPGASQWGTDLIGYNALESFGSASYYAQQLFSQNMADSELPVDVADASQDAPPPYKPAGGIGVMTWNTQAQFKDMKVTSGDKTLFESDFSKGAAVWRPNRNGHWTVQDDALTQTDEQVTDSRNTTGDTSWTDYTYTLKARKIQGSEGFIIMFHSRGRNSFLSWNIGGWNNSRSAIEKLDGNEKTQIGQDASLTISDTDWHDVKIEVAGTDIKCYFDGKLITEATDPPPTPLSSIYAAASKSDSAGQVIAKVVNISAKPQVLQINLQGASSVSPDAQGIVLTGDPHDVNSISAPKKVYPQQADIHDAAATFSHEFPAHSVTVLKFSVK
jgi:alpha-N-arabinofuranosidase